MTTRQFSADVVPARLMTEDQAADYLGDIPVAELIRQGIGRVPIGRYVRYDRFAIDAWLDARSGLAPATVTTTPEDDAEAALARFQAGR